MSADPRAPGLEALATAMVESYAKDPRASRIGHKFLPDRAEIIQVIELLLQLFYPGYFEGEGLDASNVKDRTIELLDELRERLERQVKMCLCHAAEVDRTLGARADDDCGPHASRVTALLLEKLPAIRGLLISDVQAAYDGDPAATSLDEVILAYPGFLAVTVYRVAHELYEMGVPLMPRIMTEWAHAQTGADIHPGASIGPSFFVDHATGVVVGETTTIGSRAKLYQGVTLGAISHPRDAHGRVIRNTKRHPTVEDDVTVYANATVLGGDTVLGEGSVIGGSAFVTQSVPPRTRVAMKPPELKVAPKRE